MNAAGEPALLRPLSFGEIFDRAVTLYLRNFALFTAIALVMVLPMVVLQYFAGLQNGGGFAQMIDQIQHPGRATFPVQNGLSSAMGFATIAFALVMNAFTAVAIAAAIGRIYRGAAADWRDCYAQALRRAGGIFVVLLCEVAVFLLVIFVGAFALGMIFVAAFLLVRVSAAGGVAGFAASVVVMIAWLEAMMLCVLAFALAYDALAIEDASVSSAVSRSFARIFNRSELLRATLVCLALGVIYIGISIVSISAGAVLETVKLHLLYVVASGLLSLVTTSFIGILTGVYYFDVRVRREGLDMQAEMEQLQTAGTA